MNRWIWIVVGTLTFMAFADGVLLYVAQKNAPQVVEHGQEWK